MERHTSSKKAKEKKGPPIEGIVDRHTSSKKAKEKKGKSVERIKSPSEAKKPNPSPSPALNEDYPAKPIEIKGKKMEKKDNPKQPKSKNVNAEGKHPSGSRSKTTQPSKGKKTQKTGAEPSLAPRTKSESAQKKRKGTDIDGGTIRSSRRQRQESPSPPPTYLPRQLL